MFHDRASPLLALIGSNVSSPAVLARFTMKKLVALLAICCMSSLPVIAQDTSNPSSEQLEQAIQQVQKMGFDTSKLPSKDALKQMLSGENGRRMHELAKKLQEQNPEQFQQMRDKIQDRFDKNGDGTLGPRERELAQQAFQQRQGDRRGPVAGNDTPPSDRKLNRFDRNDDGQLGPRERNAATEARQQHQQSDQNAIRIKRRSGDSQSSSPGANNRSESRPERPSRAGDQQGQQRANNNSRPPQSRQGANTNARPANRTASSRGANNPGGINRGGTSRGGSAGRGGR